MVLSFAYWSCLYASFVFAAQALDKSVLIEDPWLKVSIQQNKVNVREGESVELLCEAESTSVATIHWRLNGKRIRLGEHEDENVFVEQISNEGVRTFQHSTTNSKLKIACLNKNTVGMYECVASNGFSTESANANIRLTPKASNDVQIDCSPFKRSNAFDRPYLSKPAEIYMWTDSRIEREGVTVQLMCRAKGNPQPRISWYEFKSFTQDDDVSGPSLELLQENDQYTLLPNGDLVMKIPSHPVEGGTVFKCVALNPFGQDSVKVFLSWPSFNAEDEHQFDLERASATI